MDSTPSCRTIPGINGNEINTPAEGDTIVENSKTYVWTKRYVDGTCVVYEWVEKKAQGYNTFDYSNIYC